jgi:hypothetical protein
VAPGAVGVCVQMDPTCCSADLQLAPCPIAAQPVHGATHAFTAPADTTAAFLCQLGSSAGCCGGCGRRSSHSSRRRSDGQVTTSESREQCVTEACVVVFQKSVNSCWHGMKCGMTAHTEGALNACCVHGVTLGCANLLSAGQESDGQVFFAEDGWQSCKVRSGDGVGHSGMRAGCLRREGGAAVPAARCRHGSPSMLMAGGRSLSRMCLAHVADHWQLIHF